MTASTAGASIEILLVEDNEADARLTARVLEGARVPNTLRTVTDGAEALEYLYRRGAHADAPRPDLVLLDLSLPKRDGTEVLAAIKSDTALRRIPVVILTTSSAERDILRAYDLMVNCYLTKPLDLMEFVDVVRSVEHFWLTLVTLPPDEQGA